MAVAVSAPKKPFLPFSIANILGEEKRDGKNEEKRKQVSCQIQFVPSQTLNVNYSYKHLDHPTSSGPTSPAPYRKRVWDEVKTDDDTESEPEKKSPKHRAAPSSDSDRENVSPAPSTGYDGSSDDTSSSCESKKKKARTCFTTDQIFELERRFRSQRYLAASERGDLAQQLQLSDQQVKTWFQNRRMKEKREYQAAEARGVVPSSALPPPLSAAGITAIAGSMSLSMPVSAPILIPSGSHPQMHSPLPYPAALRSPCLPPYQLPGGPSSLQSPEGAPGFLSPTGLHSSPLSGSFFPYTGHSSSSGLLSTLSPPYGYLPHH